MLEIDFEKLSFEKAVQLFEDWGFLMQEGPRTEEITIILDGQTYRTYCTCQTEQLAEMAMVILQVRLRNSTMMIPVLDVQ